MGGLVREAEETRLVEGEGDVQPPRLPRGIRRGRPPAERAFRAQVEDALPDRCRAGGEREGDGQAGIVGVREEQVVGARPAVEGYPAAGRRLSAKRRGEPGSVSCVILTLQGLSGLALCLVCIRS